jgi:hypothetical protein
VFVSQGKAWCAYPGLVIAAIDLLQHFYWAFVGICLIVLNIGVQAAHGFFYVSTAVIGKY